MAGHNKWSKVKHRKAVVDKRKGKALSMCSRAIISAVRQAGPDPAFNFALRAALDEARYHNVPSDNIERAIKKGEGAAGGDQYEAVRYEGYGPGGVAVIVEAYTDNRTRTAANVRNWFNDYGGKLGTTGSVAHQFEHKGRIVLSTPARDEDRVIEAALAAGALDVTSEEPGTFTVLTDPADFLKVRKSLGEGLAKFAIAEAEQEMIPTVTVAVSGQTAKDLLAMLEGLEDDEDVKKVFSNADVDEAALTDD